MWVLLLAIFACATSTFALQCPSNCDCGTSDELDFSCHVGHANMTYKARINEYVKINCMGTDYMCSDLPAFNFANNITLPSLEVKECDPSILRCVPQILSASSVATVTLTNSIDTLIEDDVKDLGDMQVIFIKNGTEKYIPSAIKALPTLRDLHITNTPIKLQSNAFAQSPQLKLLELSQDEIWELPEDTFSGLTKLESLYVWGNNFSTLGVNSLRGLVSLKRISLNTNQLSSLAAGSFAHVPRLQEVSLVANKLDRLPAGVLYNLTELQNITLRFNAIQLTLEPASLSNLPSLENLHLESSRIKMLPEDLLKGDEALITLGLAHNEIPSIPQKFFSDLKSVEHIDLSYNKIELLQAGVFAPIKKLKTLNLNRNYLRSLPDYLFSGLRELNSLSIDYNSLLTISNKAFLGVERLQTLSLKYNKLTLTPQDHPDVYGSFEQYSPFDALTGLRRLHLDNNHINTIFYDWTMVLLNLEELSLAWNNFTMIQTQDCQFLSKNVTVNLQHNKISKILLSYPSLSTGTLAFEHKPSKGTILLDSNPLDCDCQIYNLSMRLRGAIPLTVEPKFVVGNARCSSPPSLEGEIFKDVPPKELNCDLTSEECDNSCPICKMRPAMKDLDLTCEKLPPVIPNPENFGVNSISLTLKTAPSYIDNLNVKLLNLTNIGLQEIPFKPTKSVETIDFSNNQLSIIPIEFLEMNTSLYLSKNPFICQCWYAEEISILQKSSRVVDIRDVTCLNGEKMLQIDVQALCSSWRAAAVASGTFIILVIIVAITVITAYKYSHEILVYITNKGLFPCCFIEDPIDASKEYDVFVSYAHKDINYLKELLPKLETEFGQKTCVHYRDWSVGDLIPDQINKSVEKSRRTIILLSPNFLNSNFANMEFRTAHNFALKEGRTRIILILLEDVTKHDKLTDELKAYIKTNTYLTWDDPNFWNRLQRALPMRNNKKFVLPDVFKQAGAKTVKSGLDVQLNSDGKLVNVAVKDMV